MAKWITIILDIIMITTFVVINDVDGNVIGLQPAVKTEFNFNDVATLDSTIVGYTKARLEGGSACHQRECNLGNLITDSMIHARVIEDESGTYWTDAAIAIVAGGGISSSIEKRSDGSITEDDITKVLTTENDLYITKISGKKLRKALEHSAHAHDGDSNGAFLQMSGVRVTYDMTKDDERVTLAEVRCAQCDVPDYSPLEDTKTYNVIIPKYLFDGGDDGHDFEPENGSTTIRLQVNDKTALIQYLEKRNFVYPEEEGRIEIIGNANGKASGTLMGSIFIVLCAVFLTI